VADAGTGTGLGQGSDDRGGNRRTEQAPAPTRVCCRRAEVVTLLRFAATLHTTDGLLTLTAELDTKPIARSRTLGGPRLLAVPRGACQPVVSFAA